MAMTANGVALVRLKVNNGDTFYPLELGGISLLNGQDTVDVVGGFKADTFENLDANALLGWSYLDICYLLDNINSVFPVTCKKHSNTAKISLSNYKRIKNSTPSFSLRSGFDDYIMVQDGVILDNNNQYNYLRGDGSILCYDGQVLYPNLEVERHNYSTIPYIDKMNFELIIPDEEVTNINGYAFLRAFLSPEIEYPIIMGGIVGAITILNKLNHVVLDSNTSIKVGGLHPDTKNVVKCGNNCILIYDLEGAIFNDMYYCGHKFNIIDKTVVRYDCCPDSNELFSEFKPVYCYAKGKMYIQPIMVYSLTDNNGVLSIDVLCICSVGIKKRLRALPIKYCGTLISIKNDKVSIKLDKQKVVMPLSVYNSLDSKIESNRMKADFLDLGDLHGVAIDMKVRFDV